MKKGHKSRFGQRAGFLSKEVNMPKQQNNAGSGTNGPHKQGEKGGKGGTYKGGAGSGGKKDASQSNPRSGNR